MFVENLPNTDIMALSSTCFFYEAGRWRFKTFRGPIRGAIAAAAAFCATAPAAEMPSRFT